ncbi:hypothetical protein VYU27_009189, partial [Nannochloropsis oceanica]
FFSRGDQLTYEGRRLLALAEAAPLDSSDRAHAGAKAAEAFVRAAAYWRTPVDIDSLDGGQNRRGRGGLSHALLRLAPTSLPIISAVVDMALVAANNFGASIYRPPVRKGKKAVVPSPLDDDDLVRSLVPQQRNELKQRCFTTVRNALMWLLDPQQREPASVDNSISGWALVQEELERAAWTLLTRALKSEDADLHSLLYTALLQDNGRESQREMLFSLSSPHLEAFLYARSQQERGKEGGREGGTEGGGLNLYKEYLFHNQRYAEAMELLESAAVAQSEDLKLNDRVRLLTEAIQCASLAQNVARTGRPGKHPRVSGPKVQALQDQLDVATLQLQVLNPALFFSTHADFLASSSLLSSSSSPSSASSVPLSSFSGSELPPSLSLMTLQKISCRGRGERWTTLPVEVEEEEGKEEGTEGGGEARFILRLAHQFAVGEDQELSQPVTVDLASLFPHHTLASSVELTLSAGQPKSQLSRLAWQTTHGQAMAGREGGKEGGKEDGRMVTLNPMEIRTFEVALKWRKEEEEEEEEEVGREVGKEEGEVQKWIGPGNLMEMM